MTKNSSIDYNGIYFPANEPVITAQNRAFRYGDGVFESIRIMDGKIPLMPFHYRRLTEGLSHLKINLPDNFTEEYCKTQLLNFAKHEKIENNGRLRFSFFRKAGGFYTPETNDAEFIIEGWESTNEGFQLNANGLTVDIYTEIEKHPNILSLYKTSNAQIYVMAAIYKKAHNLDDCLLVNSRNRIIESIDSNLFLVKDNTLFTPPLNEGCVAGTMREFLLHIANKQKIVVHENPLTIEDLLLADEAFLTNALYGIRWINTCKSKTYTNKITGDLSEILNHELIGK